MCLVLKRKASKPKIAKSDIKVYKVLFVNDNQYFTIFQEASIVIGEMYSSIIKCNEYWVTEALHSFKIKKDAVEYAELNCNRVVVECIIPKNSEYYIGVFESIILCKGLPSIASNQLIYKEIIHKS